MIKMKKGNDEAGKGGVNFKEVNLWQSVGVIRAITQATDGSEVALVQTTRETPSRKFEDTYVIYMFNDELTEQAKSLVGQTVELFGKFSAQVGDNPKMIAGFMRKVSKKTLHFATGEVVTRVHGYELFPPEAGKRQFGELKLVTSGMDYVTCKAFKGLASELKSRATKHSVIKAFGRVQSGSYTAKDGSIREVVEIMLDNNSTKLLWQAPEETLQTDAPVMAWNSEDSNISTDAI